MAESSQNYALMPLGEILLSLGYLSEEQWTAALATANRENRDFETLLLEDEMVDADRLTHARALQNNLRLWPWAKIERIVAKHKLRRIPTPEGVPALPHIAWARADGPALVILHELSDGAARAQLKNAYGPGRVQLVAVTPSTFAQAQGTAPPPAAPIPPPSVQEEPTEQAGAATGEALAAPPVDAANTLPPVGDDEAAEPNVVDGYRVIRELSRGAAGVVHLAERLSDQTQVALKQLDPKLAADERAVQFMAAERQLLEGFQHPFIIRVYGGGLWDGLPYYAMELMPGETLGDRLSDASAMSLPTIMRLWCEVADALAYAHHMGILHQDIKPSNVLLSEAGEAKLADFGIARAADAATAQDQTAAGTLLYMAPEQLRGQTLTASADIYSLGLVAFEMLTGTLPDGHLDTQTMLRRRQQRELTFDDIRRPLTQALSRRDQMDEIGASITDFARILHRCLRKNPRDRFKSAAQLVKLLRQIMNLRGWPAPRETPLPSATPPPGTSGSGPGAVQSARNAPEADATAAATRPPLADTSTKTQIPDDYEVIRLLGRGSMGEVFYARDKDTGRRVALKMITPDMAANERFRNRFQREAEVLGRLRHPCIVHIYGVQFEGPAPHIAMEYIEGEDLEDILKKQKRVSVEESVPVICAVASALEHVHAAGVIHRDLKPSNLMVTNEGDVKILDFGVAKDSEGEALTTMGAVIGTPHYMSPEQASGQPATPLSDMYALGMIWYQMLVGSVPFRGSIPEVLHMHVAIQPPRVSDAVPVPDSIDLLIARMLRKNPDQRPQTFQEVIHGAQLSVMPRLNAGQFIRRLIPPAVAFAAGGASLFVGDQAGGLQSPDPFAQAGIWAGLAAIGFGLLYSARLLLRRD